jgi:hypothetical protein
VVLAAGVIGGVTMDQATQEQVEAFVDAHGLVLVLGMLADICTTKADRISTNWGDSGMATRWQRRATQLDRLADKIRAEKPFIG